MGDDEEKWRRGEKREGGERKVAEDLRRSGGREKLLKVE
jgi:hypothetical protein